MIESEGEALRLVMRRLPCPVVVVTIGDEIGIRGITVGSFTSVSLNPPLVSFNINEASQMYERITPAEYFAVHVMGEEQTGIANRFALPDVSDDVQFEGLSYTRDATGVPVLADALAVLHCRMFAWYTAGDHAIIIGEVLSVENQREGAPVVYQDRAYRQIGEEVAPLVVGAVSPKDTP